MKKRGFLVSLSLCKNTQSFFTKNAHPCSNNKTSQKHTHAKEDVFHFDSLRFADDGFCAQKDRRELARVQVRANDVSLFTRKFRFLFFFFFFLISFLPSFGCNEWTREEGEALWMWSLSLVGCASRVGIDRSDRERRKRERGRRVVLLLLLLLFYGRFCSLEYRKRRVC